MQDCDPAQAAELIRALRDHLREMTQHLARVEARYVPGPNGHPARLEAVALRRDIAEAQMHVDRLQRRYLSADGHSERHRQVVGQVWCCQDWSLWRLRQDTRAIGIRSRSSGTRCGCITVSR